MHEAVTPRYPNPFRRVREILRLSHVQLAEKTGLSRLYIIRTEQGVYSTPSARLINFFETHIEDKLDLENQYRKYQHECRKANGPGAFMPILDEPTASWFIDLPGTSHPFREWMEYGKPSSGISVMAVCKAYCVSPALIQRFLQQPYLVHHVPGPIREALIEAGFSSQTLDALQHAYKKYRDKLYSKEKSSA